jgi:hypothetical protein
MTNLCIPPQNLEDKLFYMGVITEMDVDPVGRDDPSAMNSEIGIRNLTSNVESYLECTGEQVQQFVSRYEVERSTDLIGKPAIIVYRSIPVEGVCSNPNGNIEVDGARELIGLIPVKKNFDFLICVSFFLILERGIYRF